MNIYKLRLKNFYTIGPRTGSSFPGPVFVPETETGAEAKAEVGPGAVESQEICSGDVADDDSDATGDE